MVCGKKVSIKVGSKEDDSAEKVTLSKSMLEPDFAKKPSDLKR